MTEIERLKAAIASALPATSASDPLAVSSTVSDSPTLTGTYYNWDDSRLRRLGGVWNVAAAGFPFELFGEGRSAHYNNDPVNGWAPNTQGVEFVLDGNAFEVGLLGIGGIGNMLIEVDGQFTNSGGYPIGNNSDGRILWTKVELPQSSQRRRIRLILPYRPVEGIKLAAGAALADPSPAQTSSVVFIGDSVTEGAVATQVWRRWAVQAALRLGIDNYIVSGVGSAGYLNRGSGPFRTFRERLEDVEKAADGKAPDMVVIAGGLNDANFYTAEQVGAEALAYFRAIRATLPNTPIVVLGPFAGYDPYDDRSSIVSQQLPLLRDAIFAAARQVSGTYTVDVTDWVTFANRDAIFRERGADGPHPTDAGHSYYGQRAADAIRAIISGL